MDLWIIGGSGAALEVWAVARALEARGTPAGRLRGFVTPDGAAEFDPEGLEIAAEEAFLARPAEGAGVVLALGSPRLRERVAARYLAAGFAFTTLVHPTAVVGPSVSLGRGCVLMALSVLETHVEVGDHALINVGATVAHNGRLGHCCSLGPGVHLAGWVTVGDRCDLGVGSCVRPRIHLPDDTILGAGAAVVSPPHASSLTLVGVPARPLAR